MRAFFLKIFKIIALAARLSSRNTSSVESWKDAFDSEAYAIFKSGRAAFAFQIVQLRALAARGSQDVNPIAVATRCRDLRLSSLKHLLGRKQKALSIRRLQCLSQLDERPPLLIVQLWRLDSRVATLPRSKAGKMLSIRKLMRFSSLDEPPQLFYVTILRKEGVETVKKDIQIAIDGPAGAGKSTIAKIVAEKLGYTYIDTGAMYRALTLKALKEHIDLENAESVTNLLANTTIELKPSESGQLVFLDGQDVSNEIRSNEVTGNVSRVACHATMREIMVERQREMAERGGVVMDGRDIATAVLPKAELKVYMSATVAERARRRYEDNKQRGIESSIETLKEEIALRDKLDSEREASPLVQAPDALFLDTTDLTIQQAADAILKLASERMA